MHRLSVLFLVPLLSLAACNNHHRGDNAIEHAMSVPPGNATGTDRSGEYSVEIYTASCEGRCGAVDGGWTISFCDVGQRDMESFTAKQEDGELQIDGDDDNYVSRYTGGVDSDGTFEVGGYATSLGGAIEATAFVEGSFEEKAKLQAVADIHIWGTYDEESVDCFATYEVEGDRSGISD